jgi:hypothetical protein
MNRKIGRFTGAIVLAAFLPSLGTLLSPPGSAIADTSARAAGEEAAESIAPHPPPGDSIPPERLERWRAMPPEERERIRERYRRWKELPPEKRERIMERKRRWRELPEEQRRYLRDRRELMKVARPEDRVVVRDFFRRMRSLPPEERRAEREKIWTWRALPAGEREEAMRSWPYYLGLSGRDRETLRWFLFAAPGERPPDG